MRLIKPRVEIMYGLTDFGLTKVERAARTCYKSEDKIGDGSTEKMAKMLVDRGHEAMLEFHDIMVKFICDRGVSHEIVRHRVASYAQESTRYCNYSKDKFDNQITFIIPEWLNIPEGEYGFMDVNEDKSDESAQWMFAMAMAEGNYMTLTEKYGWSAQKARSVLPNSLKTEIVMKANLREWRHFFKLRCSKAAHPQMREVAIPLLRKFRSEIPIVFNDITY